MHGMLNQLFGQVLQVAASPSVLCSVGSIFWGDFSLISDQAGPSQ